MDQREKLLKKLTEAHGVPGYEAEIRGVIKEELSAIKDVEQDKIGSLIYKTGNKVPRVMIAAHMDEVGFMVSHMSKEGFIKFLPLGGWWDQVILGQRVIIKTHKGDILGIIGAKPPHMISAEERKKIVEKKDMYIDIGATSKEELEKAGVRLGDPIIPDSTFEILANKKTYMSKAFDDRVGISLMIEALTYFSKKTHPNTLYGVATVMEEVGMRGAKTSAEMVHPDVAIILESDICGDVPGIKPEDSEVKLGKGPCLSLFDARMIPNLKLRDLIIDIANEQSIPLQFSTMTGGATDGGLVHLHGTGVPTIVIGVCSRHIHSHSAIIHRDDYDKTLQLIIAVIEKLTEEKVTGLIPS